jgi:SAM-dependent methyltransferase
MVIPVDGRIIRLVNRESENDVADFLNSDVVERLIGDGVLVKTELLGGHCLETLKRNATFREVFDPAIHSMLIEHQRIPFQSFPYEWSAEMLHAAAELTLEVFGRLLAAGMGLKDATPYNVLFRGSQPVFIDLLSFEHRDPLDPTWRPMAQFVRTFLIPLLINRRFGIGLDQILTTRRDGVYPADISPVFSFFQKIRPPVLTLVTLPAFLARRRIASESAIYRERHVGSEEKARFILERMVAGLRRKLDSVRPRPNRNSEWSNYMMQSEQSDDYFPAKERFVERQLADGRFKNVLDIGCNTGHFSALAARSGSCVVAIDSDEVAVGKAWRQASEEKLDKLPLVMDIARPTPSIGWRNTECPSFLERAIGSFDCVMMLATIHHLLVRERIPLGEIMRLMAQLTTDVLIVEYVCPDDPMFRMIARGRDLLYESLTHEEFESVSTRFFEIEERERPGSACRWIYRMRRRRGD